MTVETMIKELQKCDPKARVIMHDHRLGSEVLFVVSYLNGKPTTNIVLECEEDVYLPEELKEEFEHRNEIACDEKDFYNFWVDKGITPEMVEKYLSKEISDRMKSVTQYSNHKR